MNDQSLREKYQEEFKNAPLHLKLASEAGFYLADALSKMALFACMEMEDETKGELIKTFDRTYRTCMEKIFQTANITNKENNTSQ